MIKNILENYKEVFIYNSRVWYLPVYQLIFREKDYSIIFRAPIAFYSLYFSEEDQSEEFLVHLALLDIDNLTAELFYSSGNHSEISNISDAVRCLISKKSEKQTLEEELEEDDDDYSNETINNKQKHATTKIPRIPSDINLVYPFDKIHLPKFF